MDEKTPHMHVSFCPITPDKRLSAKDLLGNQAQLSRWQTEYHRAMSSRWSELERGLSSMETGRKHIPLWLFKQAEKLDKQVEGIEAALESINLLNAKKQREKALDLLSKWLPQAERFTAQVKTVDNHIKALELADSEVEKRVRDAENAADKRIDNIAFRMQSKIDDKDKELLETRREAHKLRQQIRNAETMLGKIPLELREKLLNKSTMERKREYEK